MKHFLATNKLLKYTEIVALFVVTPIVLFLSISIIAKITCVLLGVIYITLVSIFIEKFQKVKLAKTLKNKALKHIAFRFFIIAFLTIGILYIQNKEALFNVMLTKPTLWLKFSGIYILFSVIPQELIYRTFFVKRYQELIKNKVVFLLINAVLFSFAHIWFRSELVLLFTFVGSLLFTNTYLQTKSIRLVILEHSLYGVWLYTVGYGALFMFPT
jgi:membrane protease YdiL (CAAX protease family)